MHKEMQCENICVRLLKMMDMTQFITSRKLKQLLSMKGVFGTFRYVILLSLAPNMMGHHSVYA
jgi:hypothetical protein